MLIQCAPHGTCMAQVHRSAHSTGARSQGQLNVFLVWLPVGSCWLWLAGWPASQQHPSSYLSPPLTTLPLVTVRRLIRLDAQGFVYDKKI